VAPGIDREADILSRLPFSATAFDPNTTAMHLLRAGVDISVIALWLGHESPVTTHQYVEADLAMKERALAKLHEPDTSLQRYRAPDSLIDFLKTL
jgi:integrase